MKRMNTPILISLAILAFNLPTVADENSAPSKPVTEQLVDTMTKLAGGPHAGYRANHAKGIVVQGEFTPAKTASAVTKAVHMQNITTPVIVRFSDATGVPNIPDANG